MLLEFTLTFCAALQTADAPIIQTEYELQAAGAALKDYQAPALSMEASADLVRAVCRQPCLLQCCAYGRKTVQLQGVRMLPPGLAW